jgi:hypothetical protein
VPECDVPNKVVVQLRYEGDASGAFIEIEIKRPEGIQFETAP